MPSRLTTWVNRWGWASASWIISEPPLLCPSTGAGRPMPRVSMTTIASRRSASQPYSAAWSLSPWPRWSQAITRQPAAAIFGANSSYVRAKSNPPWTKKNGGAAASPHSCTATLRPPTSTMCSRSGVCAPGYSPGMGAEATAPTPRVDQRCQCGREGARANVMASVRAWGWSADDPSTLPVDEARRPDLRRPGGGDGLRGRLRLRSGRAGHAAADRHDVDHHHHGGTDDDVARVLRRRVRRHAEQDRHQARRVQGRSDGAERDHQPGPHREGPEAEDPPARDGHPHHGAAEHRTAEQRVTECPGLAETRP